MSEVINLRQMRKRKARSEREEQAAENRIRFGRTKAERAKLQAEENLAAKRHDSHRIGHDD